MKNTNAVKSSANKVKYILFALLMLCVSNVFAADAREWQTKELSEAELNKISDLSTLYGYVRYFYPNPNLEKFDWYKFLTYALQEMEACESEEQAWQTLLALFNPLCPQLSIHPCSQSITAQPKGKTPFYVCENKNDYQGMIHAIQKTEKEDGSYPVPDSLYSFPLSGNMMVSFPLAVSELPKKTKALMKLNSKVDDVDVRLYSKPLWRVMLGAKSGVHFLNKPEFRLANEVIRCNVITHFYPYFAEDKLSDTWNNASRAHWKNVAACRNFSDYYYAARSYLQPVKDSHVSVNFTMTMGLASTYSPVYYPDIELRYCDNQFYVASTGDSSIAKGSFISHVNKIPVKRIVDQKLEQTSFSNKGSAMIKLASGGLFESYKGDSAVDLTFVTPDDKTITATLKINKQNPLWSASPFIKYGDDGYTYINLTSEAGSYELFEQALPSIQQSKGLIFDLRGYSREWALSILANVIEKPIYMGNLTKPVFYFPNQQNAQYQEMEKWGIFPAHSPESEAMAVKYEYPLPNPLHIDKPCVFLADGASISFAETLLEMIKHYKLGPIVGESTAGCNGDITFIKLPFASFMMTGNKFTNRDGSQHHGKGIEPDLYVTNSYGIDRQLEAAKKLLSEQAD